jgi:hypothetical protein
VRRILVPALITACAVIALLGVLLVGWIGWDVADAARDGELDRSASDILTPDEVERLAGITLPATATGLHTTYTQGLDYLVVACFTLPKADLPAFTADLPAFAPGGETDPPEGCPAPAPVLTTTPQHQDGPVFRTVVVSAPGTGPVTVYVSAFTT